MSLADDIEDYVYQHKGGQMFFDISSIKLIPNEWAKTLADEPDTVYRYIESVIDAKQHDGPMKGYCEVTILCPYRKPLAQVKLLNGKLRRAT